MTASVNSAIVADILTRPGLERLQQWAEIGPVQRAAVELLVENVLTDAKAACAEHDMESFGILPIRAAIVTSSCIQNIDRKFSGQQED